MTHVQITEVLLKKIIVCISLIDIHLKGSNLMFMLSFELFPFLLLFLGEKIMLFNLSLEFGLFLFKLLLKTFVIFQKTLLFLLKFFEIFLVLNSPRISFLDLIQKVLIFLIQQSEGQR